MIDVGTMFSSSWTRFSKNIGMGIGVFLVGSIAASFLGAITLGIAAFPVYAGLFKSFRKMQRGETPDFNDLFSEFSNFSQWFTLWVAMLVIGLVVGIVMFILCLLIIGYVLLPFVGIGIGMLLFFTIPLMLEKRIAAIDAIKASIEKVKSSFGALFLPMLLAMIVSGVFAILTGPWMMIAYWDIYDAAFAPGSQV